MNYEIINFSERMPVRCVMYHFGEPQHHLHDYFEILFVLTGTLNVILNGRPFTLEPEDIMTIDGHVPHELHGNDTAVISVQFEQALFEKTLPEPKHPKFNCNSAIQNNNSAFDRIRRLIARLVKNNVERRQGYTLRNWSFVYDLMDVLYNNFRVEATERDESGAHRYAKRILEITGLINERFRENLTLTELADHVFLSAPYLSKFIRRQFGMTFHQYLTKVRLNHALQELLYSGDTIENISDNSGFPNAHAFVQAFRKEYGVLPSIYRRDFLREAGQKTSTVIEQHDYMAILKKYLEKPEQIVRSEQTLVRYAECDVTIPGTALRHTWKTLLNVGRAADLLIADIRDMVRAMRKNIGFRYIKLSGILNDELRVCTRAENGDLVINYIYLDIVLDFVVGIGMRPLMQFSYMPEALAEYPRKTLFNHPVSEPKDITEWAELLSAVTRHCIARYGIEEVRKWLFCVWAQPDTPQQMFGFTSDELFYHFYRESFLAVKKCDSQLTFGSPAFYFALKPGGEKWYFHFLHWCAANDCMPEFLSFVYYDTVMPEEVDDEERTKESFGFWGGMTLNRSTDGFQSFVDLIISELKHYYDWQRPILLTEWNSTPSQQDLLNDTCYKSCYIARCILEQYDRLDSFGYWSLTDLMAEAPLPRQLFFGGIGLFTVNGIPKPAYYVFEMLNKLGEEKISQGPGWFITRNNRDYAIMLYNYRHYSYLYALGERFDMTFTDRYTPFSPEQSLDVQLKLTGIIDGEYLVRETSLSRDSGSAFDNWVSMGAIESDAEEDIEYLKAVSRPAEQKYPVTATGGVLELDFLLDLLEVRLIQIEPRN